MSNLLDRVLNEPAVITAVILAVGNLIGQDFTGVAAFVESAVVLIAGFIVRSQVTPVRSL